MLTYIIIVNDNGELKSVTSDNIPAKISRYLESAISLALDVDSAADELRPSITIGGLTDDDRARLAKLDALEAWGVDAWDGYDDAIAAMDEPNSDGDTAEAA